MWKIKSYSIICLLLAFTFSYAEESLQQGDFYLKSKQYLKAKEYFSHYVEDAKLADRALMGLAKAEYYLGNYYEVTVALKRVLRDFKNSPFINEANLFMGLSLFKIGRINDAEFYLKKVEEPLDKQAKIALGWIALYKGDLKTVESILNKLDRKSFDEPEADLLRIKYLAYSGKTEEALKALEKNSKLNKSIYDIDKAEILIKAKNFSEAERILIKLIKTSGRAYDTIKAKKLLFESYLAQNKIEEALKVGKEVSLYDSSDEFKMKLYSIYISQKNYDEALKTLFVLRNRDFKIKKIEEFIKNLIAEDKEKAGIYIMKAYSFLNPDSSLLIESANLLISQGKFNEAKSLLKKVQTGPRRFEALIPYCKILIKEGKYKEAKKLIEPIKDKNLNAMALYGLISYKEGDKITALNYLRKASSLADLEFSDGDRKKAISYWIKASKLGNSEASLKAADYFYLSKNKKEAVFYYKKAIDSGIQDKESLLWAYYQYGKLTKNKTYLEKVANSNGSLSQAAKELLEKL
jgi:predicted Zn-dependent protease